MLTPLDIYEFLIIYFEQKDISNGVDRNLSLTG